MSTALRKARISKGRKRNEKIREAKLEQQKHPSIDEYFKEEKKK